MRRRLLLILLILTSLMLVGCSNGKKTSKKLRYGIYELGTNLNPFFYSSQNDKTILNLTFMTLFTKDRSGNLIYQIADSNGIEIDGYNYNAPGSMYITYEDGKWQYVITLKDDILSSSGNKYTINDLIFNFYVLFDPSNANTSYSSLPLIGLDEYYQALENEDTYDDAHIDGIKKLSNKKMSLEMTRELSEAELDLLNIYLVPMANVNSNINFAFDYHMFGFKKGDVSSFKNKNLLLYATGPFIITSHTDSKVVFKSNQAYYYDTPKVDTFEIIKILPKKYDEDGYVESGGDPFYQINEGWMDFAMVELNDKTLDEIPRYNRNDKLVGNCLSLYEINEKYGIVYSTTRFDGSMLDSLGLSDNYSILNEVSKFKIK